MSLDESKPKRCSVCLENAKYRIGLIYVCERHRDAAVDYFPQLELEELPQPILE